MAVQLNSSYLRRSYQLLSKLSLENLTGEEAFERASNIIYEWAKRKFSKIFRQMPYRKATFDDKRDGNEIGVIYTPDKGCFVFRGVHPDTCVPGRMWITDTELCKIEDDYWFAVRLSVTSLHFCTEDVPLSRPDFVRLIIDNIGISDVIQISNKSHLLSTWEDVNAFIRFLENPDRHFPVVLVTPYCPSERTEDGYMMNAAQMADDLSGVAHVFQITQDAIEYLTQGVGTQWSAFNGAVRTYYPGICFNDSDYYQHPLLTQKSIRLRNTIESDDSNLCMHEIEDHIWKYTVTHGIQWEKHKIDFYLAVHQDYLSARRSATMQSRKELIASYEEQLSQLQKQSEENMALADSYAKDCEDCSNEIDWQRQLIRQLKSQIATLRFQLNNATKGESEHNIPENGSYAEIEEWAKQYYPEKLMLLPRAVRSLKDACYIDSKLVYKCLKLLATSYYDYRMGIISYNEFTDACKQIDAGLEERGAITDTAAGMQGDTYYVQYRGKKRKLERHLAKGNSKDRRYCLRIYFFWDDQDTTIVIGDLPHHLDTSVT